MEREWEVINIKGQNMLNEIKVLFMFANEKLVQFENGGAREDPTDQETVELRDAPNAA